MFKFDIVNFVRNSSKSEEVEENIKLEGSIRIPPFIFDELRISILIKTL